MKSDRRSTDAGQQTPGRRPVKIAAGCLTLAVWALAGCGASGPATKDVVKPARTSLQAAEPSLEQLAAAVRDADATDKTSLITVQAAAQRASQALDDARSELRDLLNAGNVADADARRLRTQMNALSDVQGLADALADAKLSAPRIEAAYATEQLARSDLDSDMQVPAINANLLTDDLRHLRQEAAQVQARRDAARRQAAADRARTGQPSAPVGSTGGVASSGLSYFTFTGGAFQARLPQGSGWGSPSESQPTPGRLFRTNVRGPGGLFVIIDYTPFEPARFGSGYSSRSVVGQTAFGAAVRYEFQGGRIPECQRSRCVDYIINDAANGSGFGVLAGGGDAAAAIAQTVAESVVPTGGG